MGPIAVRRRTRRLRRHLTGLVLVLALGGAVAVHHSDVAMGDTAHDGMATAVHVCVGVFTAVGAAVAAVALGLVPLRRAPGPLLPAMRERPSRTGVPRSWARAGPPLLRLLCVCRR